MKIIKNNWYSVECLAGSDAAEIFIYDEIGLWGITAKDFVNDLRKITAPTINVHINSPGGSVFDGMTIFNALQNQKGKEVHTFIDGIAASIASVIALAGKTVNIAANGFFFIHNPSAFVGGTSKSMRKTADDLDKIRDQIVSVYVKKSGAEAEEVRQWMDDETLFNADEAKANGFADNVGEEIKVAAVFEMEKFGFKNFNRYETLRNLFNQNHEGGNSMDIETLKAKHPELYEKIFNLGKTAGNAEATAAATTAQAAAATAQAAAIAEAKAAGVVEGTAAGSPAAVAQGAENERKRIQDIEALSRPGAEKVIAANKFNPEMTKEKVAILILAQDNALTADQRAALEKDGAALLAQAQALKNNPPATGAEKAEEEALAARMAAAVNAKRKQDKK